MKIVAVVFDMDGVLFDTERIGVQSWTEAAEPTGLQNAYEIARMCIGRTIPGTKEVFMAEAEKQGSDHGTGSAAAYRGDPVAGRGKV